jgi:FixJ family two-component response regulator
MDVRRISLTARRPQPVAVVDDDIRVLESIADLLTSANIETRTFSSGEELLQSIAWHTCSCLITDVRMPGTDGWELLRHANATSPQVPVIFISAYQDREAVERALSLGVSEFLFKPFDGEELLRAVATAQSAADL